MNKQLLNHVRLVCLDMDGTIYRGSILFDCTIPFLDFLTAKGIRFCFLTNNSSVSKDYYVQKLNKMGISATREHFYTSTDYTIAYLRERMPETKKLCLLATPVVEEEFKAAGFQLVSDKPDAVVVTFDKTLTYEKLCRAAYFLKCGVPTIATHPDVFCPTEKAEWLVDCGAIIACLETSTGCKMKVLGKPDPGMLIHAAAERGITDMKQVLMAGDRLSTDVAVGVNAGAVSCHIMDPTAEVHPVAKIIPDFEVESLAGLQEVWQSIESQK